MNIISNFEGLGLSPALLRAARDLGYREPTAVQIATIPHALNGQDILASAATGSGKSAAFGLPMVQLISEKPRGKTQGLVLVPTRELAVQIAQHLSALAQHTHVRVAAVYGGVGLGAQGSAFRQGTEIVVATPGRLIDHLTQGTASLSDISILTLDEADRMLDMGFLPAVRRIVKKLRTQRQTLFFSATMPPPIASLVREMCKNPMRIDVASSTAARPLDERLVQTAYSVDQSSKTDLLVELLKDNTIYSVIAFTRTKSRANRLAATLSKRSVPAERIHGDRSQTQRIRALEDFKRGKYRVLVATDIAARGIDIAELGHVVNFDVPAAPEDYVHRIGRTARAEATGNAITFVSPDEDTLFRQIEKMLGKRINRASPPSLPAAASSALAATAAPRTEPRFSRSKKHPA